MTAEDVRWTWEAQTDPDLAWGYAQSKENIRDVEVTGPHSLRVHFHRPSPSQLTELNEGVILPRHAWSELPFSEWRSNESWFVEHLVVNGPFDLESWARQEQIVLRRNEAYHQAELPRLDRVVFRVVPQKQNQIGELLSIRVVALIGNPINVKLQTVRPRKNRRPFQCIGHHRDRHGPHVLPR